MITKKIRCSLVFAYGARLFPLVRAPLSMRMVMTKEISENTNNLIVFIDFSAWITWYTKETAILRIENYFFESLCDSFI